MSWGTLFAGHPLRTRRRITVLLELTDLSSIKSTLGLKCLDKSTVKSRSQIAELLRRKGGRKTVTEPVEVAASPFTAPKNQLRGV